MKCYVCDKELVDTVTDPKTQCKKHGEHIIHNAILGHLKSDKILCEDCGGKYSQDDALFAGVFSPIVALLKAGGRLRQPDRKIKDMSVKGQIFVDRELSTSPIYDIIFRDGKIFPAKPDYKLNENAKVLDIICDSKQYKNYSNSVISKLKAVGIDISEFKIVPHCELSKEGLVGLFFSKGKENFNESMRNGLMKIAVEFALDRGVCREELKDVLLIDPNTNESRIDYENAYIIPFCTLNIVDGIFENERVRFERTYPSHSLYLFTINHQEGKALYCYIDLFSTFQFYVLLNRDYKGNTVNEYYAQKLLKNYQYTDEEIDSMSNNDLDEVIRGNNLDIEQINNSSSARDAIKTLLRKKGPEFDLMQMKNNAYKAIERVILLFIVNRRKPVIDIPLGIDKSTENIITTYLDDCKMTPQEQLELYTFLEKHYRDYVLEISTEERLKYNAYPISCTDFFNEHNELMRVYMISVYSKLCAYCYNVAGINLE